MAGTEHHSPGFQHGGQRRAAIALREEYAVTIAELERRRDAAYGREEKERLQREIEVARKTLTQRLRGLRWGLLGKGVMKKQHALKIALTVSGSFLLIAGLFLPTTRYSHGPTMDYWQDAGGDCLLLMGLVLLTIVLGLLGLRRAFSIMALCSAAFALLAFAVEAWPGEVIGGSDYGITSGLSWGWSVILSGAALLALVGLLSAFRKADIPQSSP